MNIRGVIFDFGNVICFPPSPEQWKEAAEFCGVADLHEAFWKHRGEYDAGSDAAGYWHGVAKQLGLSFNDQMVAAMIEREIAFWSNLDQRVLAWARELRRAGIRTAMLSNLPRAIGESLVREPGFIDHFDHLTLSYELGVIKPDRAIYLHAVNGLGIQPHEALFIDDRPENVEGGRAAGLHSEQFVTWEEFVARQVGRYGLPLPPV